MQALTQKVPTVRAALFLAWRHLLSFKGLAASAFRAEKLLPRWAVLPDILHLERRTEWLVVVPVIFLGLVLRLMEAARSYLNPDEILHFFLSLSVDPKQDHPPLLFVLLHPIAAVTSSELALRLIPVLAGAIFPWVVYRWLAKVWTRGAALAALVILTFSPNLIALSAQVRGYTLELLFAALALLFLDTALDRNSLRMMILFSISLDLAILSEYSAAWFAGAVGIYFLLQMSGRKIAPRLLIAWAVGQMSALAIYWALYLLAIRPRLAFRHGVIDEYLTGAFPGPRESALAFSVLATLKQFAYAFSSIPLGVGAALLFAGALVILWRRAPNRSLAVFLVVTFLLACAAALLKLHPYGRSRHTVILCLFAAIGVRIALERMFRSRPWMGGLAALALALVWMFAAEPDQNNITRSRDRKASMIAAIDFVRSAIPPSSLVLGDEQSIRYLRFYLPDPRSLRLESEFDNPQGPPIGSLRVIWRRWDFRTVDDFLSDLASVRAEFGLSRDAPIWIVDGGFDSGIAARLRDRFPGISLPSFRDIDGALNVFQTPAGM